MKLQHLQEARILAPAKRNVERASMDDLGKHFPKEPKSEVKGDLAWHLKRFWRQSKKSSWRARRNPKWSKLAKEAVKATLSELTARNREWEYVDPADVYKELGSAESTYTPGWYWTGGILQNVPRIVNADYSNKSKLVDDMKEEFFDMWERFESRLPLKETPVSVEVDFFLKKGIVCFHKDNHNVDTMTVVYDKNGKILRMFGSPNHNHDGNSWNISAMVDFSPEQMRNTWHYYKKHNYK